MDKQTFKLFIAITTSVLTPSVYAVTLGFSPTDPDANASVGTPYSVDLTVSGLDGAVALGDYDLNVGFQTDNVSLTVNDVVLGNQLQLSEVESLSDISIENGQLNLSEVSLNDAAILSAEQADNFTLGTLTFTPTTTGDSALGISVNALADQNGESLGLPDIESGSISVNPNIRNNSNLTDSQKDTGLGLLNVCNGLNRIESLTGEQQELRAVACAISGNTQENGHDLQNIAAEETFAAASMAIKTASVQSSAITTQLSNRRLGINGFRAKNFKLVQNGELLSLAALGLAGAMGGAAGDDEGSSAMSERLGGFVNASANFGEMDASSREDAFNFNREEVIVGLDYLFSEQWVAGAALGYAYYNANFQKSALVAGGSTKAHNYSASLYSSYYIGDFYIDGVATYTRSDIAIQRKISLTDNGLNINTAAQSSPESDQFAVSLGIGHLFHNSGVDFGPYLRLAYLNLDIDQYREKGASNGLNLAVANQQVESLESVLGAQISYAWSQSFGVLTPQISVDWHHEFMEDQRVVKTSYVVDPNRNNLPTTSDSPDRDFASLSVGVNAVFRHSLQAALTYQTVLGQHNVESHAFTAGIRLAF